MQKGFENKSHQALSAEELDMIAGGDAFSSGFYGGAAGGGLAGFGGATGALMSGASVARWGAIGGFGGAAIGFAAGVAYYYLS